MPINPRTKATLLRISASLFALSSALAAWVAYSAHQSGEPAAIYVKQSIIYLSMCVVFLSVAHIKAKVCQPRKDVPPDDPK